MENTTFDLAKELKNCTNSGKEIGYIVACNDLHELLTELERSKLISLQLLSYIHHGLIAKRNIYVNTLTNERQDNTSN